MSSKTKSWPVVTKCIKCGRTRSYLTEVSLDYAGPWPTRAINKCDQCMDADVDHMYSSCLNQQTGERTDDS